MVILPGIRVIVRRFLCIERRFLSDWSKKFYVDVLAQCALATIPHRGTRHADLCHVHLVPTVTDNTPELTLHSTLQPLCHILMVRK